MIGFLSQGPQGRACVHVQSMKPWRPPLHAVRRKRRTKWAAFSWSTRLLTLVSDQLERKGLKQSLSSWPLLSNQERKGLKQSLSSWPLLSNQERKGLKQSLSSWLLLSNRERKGLKQSLSSWPLLSNRERKGLKQLLSSSPLLSNHGRPESGQSQDFFIFINQQIDYKKCKLNLLKASWITWTDNGPSKQAHAHTAARYSARQSNTIQVSRFGLVVRR